MRKYKYVAVNLYKEKFHGVFEAENEKVLATELAKQNLFLISYTVDHGRGPSSFFTLGSGKVKLGDLTAFCRQFAIMINSGTSILECLSNLRAQSYDKFFRDILDQVYEDVKGGKMLSEALDKHSKVFPAFFRNMIYVGEASGKLEMVFNNLADYYENDAAMRKKARGAMAYPVMLLLMTLAIVVMMMLFVVPTFRDSLSSMDVQPNVLTRIVWNLSDFFLANWKILLVSLIAVVVLFLVIRKTPKGRLVLDKIKLSLPYIRKIQMAQITARFARGFGLLLSSGMDIVDAMDTIKVVLGNQEELARFTKATEDVKQGAQLTASFNKYKLFPPLLIQMVAVGERSNALDEVLMRSCGFFDEQVNTTIQSMIGKMQPILLGIMGAVVGVLFVAMYSPMISIMTTLV